MTVIIKELEHIQPAGRSAELGTGGAGNGGGAASQQNESPEAIRSQLLSVIRREASRQARVWAD